ncbi:MAG: ABC transporter ATP-binding protein [Deltaproteobacteria bacterium]|nr:ABC transporter ATP-binding protein [Deltaproteobacteria bacterium]
MPNETRLSVTGLAHAYGRREVLRGLDFEVRRGEVFGLLGPNGSGKSTAMAILAGLIERKGGNVSLDGRPWNLRDAAFRARIGVVFQSPGLDAKLTALENLGLAARLYGYSRSESLERARIAMSRAGLEDRGGDAVGTLSGGMRRRVDIARALLHDPDLLLMDEPTAGLDEASFRATWQRLEKMRGERDLTVLLATHRPEEAERCDRLAIIHEGRAAIVDTPAALKARVASDVVVLRGEGMADLAAPIAERFGVEALYDAEDDELVIDADRGHELVPRLVEAYPGGRLTSVSLRHPSLADVFLKVTGHALGVEIADGGGHA